MQAPAERRPADRFEAISQLVVARRDRARACRPHDHLAGGPRGLQPNLTNGVRDGDCRGRMGGSGQEVVCGIEPAQLLLEVGDHLVAFRAVQLADCIQVVLGLLEQTFERQQPGARVGLEECQLVCCGGALGGRPGGGFESLCVLHV